MTFIQTVRAQFMFVSPKGHVPMPTPTPLFFLFFVKMVDMMFMKTVFQFHKEYIDNLIKMFSPLQW